MSLATRCPACGTVFRVVRDQLKVSEGWVRCGRCSEVFNAGERLFELEQDPAARRPAVAPPAPETRGAVARVGAALAPPSPAPPWYALEAPAVAPDEPIPATAAPASAPSDAPTVRAADAAETTTARVELAQSLPQAIEAPAQSAQPPRPTADAPASPPTDTALDLRADPASAQSQPTPGFVLRAERAERRRHPLRRGGLALLCLLLAGVLAGQVALHYRDDVAARWPVTQPVLQAACGWLGCQVGPPRHIDSLAVDSSGLVRVEGSDLYRLSLVLQNRSAITVRMPAIDLVLTDAQGRTTARRVVSAAELGSDADHLPPRGEVALQAMLDLSEQRIAGYTVELFYP